MLNKSPIPMRLKQARQMAGLSQAELGIKAGIDEFVASPRINQYERGKHFPNYHTIERLAEALDVPVPFLYCRQDALAELILFFDKFTEAEQQLFLDSHIDRY